MAKRKIKTKHEYELNVLIETTPEERKQAFNTLIGMVSTHRRKNTPSKKLVRVLTRV